jgi:hypothetical protein
MMRLTAEEEEIQQHCGCGKEVSTMPTETMEIDSNDVDSSDGETGSTEATKGTRT